MVGSPEVGWSMYNFLVDNDWAGPWLSTLEGLTKPSRSTQLTHSTQIKKTG